MPLVPWNGSVTVNTSTTSSQAVSKVVQLNDGTVVVTWVDDSSGNKDIKFQRYDALGNKIGIETLGQAASANDQFQAGITALSDGGFVISYVDVQGNVLFGQKFFANGTANGGQIILSNPAFLDAGIESPPVIQALAGGEFAVFYTTNNFSGSTGYDVVGRIVNAAGVPGAAFSVPLSLATTGTQSSPAVALTQAGDIMVTWVSNDNAFGNDIYVRRFSPAGVPVSPVPYVVVNADTALEQVDPSITALNNGFFVVTWTTANTTGSLGNDIHGQIIDSDGNRYGPEFLAGTTQLSNQVASKVVALADGKFMVFYTTFGSGADSLRAQVFNSNGTTAGLELVVGNVGPGFSTFPDAVVLADGRVLITWTDFVFSANDFSVKMQILDPREGVINGTADADKIWGHDGNVDFISAGDGADTVYGLAGADAIYGGAGADQLFGGRGDDTLYGGNDADMLMGGYGADEIYGDAGVDTITFVQSRGGVTVNLQTGEGFGAEAEGDSYFSIESVRGSNFGDTLFAANTGSTLVGFDGIDTLTGGTGADTFNGGNGGDIINGGAGTDIAYYSSTSAAITLNLLTNVNTGGEAQGDVLTDVEQISGTSSGDTILGNSLANVFYGNGGNDRLGGGTGVDTLLGGTGADTFVFASGDTGQTEATADRAFDYTKGAVGTGDKIDFTTALTVGGIGAAATATQADISQTTGIATFFAGSGTSMADALSDIATSMTTGGNTVGEFALFRVNSTGNFYQFISDGVAGVGVNDVLVQLTGVTTVSSINLTAGDLTILT
jgi:Ca2+-binding RTX toxin-like protein